MSYVSGGGFRVIQQHTHIALISLISIEIYNLVEKVRSQRNFTKDELGILRSIR